MKKLIFANAQYMSQEMAQISWVGNVPVQLVRNPRILKRIVPVGGKSAMVTVWQIFTAVA
jgi:hypothetical protein